MAVELATVAAVYEAIEKAYETYKKIEYFLTPNPPNLILTELHALHSDFQAMQGKLDLVSDAVKQLLNQEQQAYLLELRRDLDKLRGQSRTAIDQLATWVDSSGQDVQLRSLADNNSRLPANTLLEGDSFFFRPDATEPDNVFDHRVAITAYVYTLTVRLGVMAALNPQFRANVHAREELGRHVARLTWIIAKADRAIEPQVTGRVDAGNYFWQSSCLDKISGYQTDVDRTAWRPGGQEELDDALASATEYVRADMQITTGLTNLMGFRDSLEYAASDPRIPRWTAWAPVPVRDLVGTWAPPPITAVSSKPRGVTLFWWHKSTSQVRGASFDPDASPAGWMSSFAATADGTCGGKDITAVSPDPGKITVIFRDATYRGIAATHTDPAQSSGWLKDPIPLVPPSAQANNFAAVAPAPGSVSLFWQDGPIGAIFTTLREGAGEWVSPHPVTPPGACSRGMPITAVSSGPRGVSLFWPEKDRSVRSTYYDPREPQPAWVPPFEVAPPGSVAVPELGVAAVSASPWSISLFWPGKDRAVWSTYFDSSQPAARWVHPFPITPSRACMYGTRVVAVTPAQRSISLFWIGADRRVRSTYDDPQQSPDKGWADWFPLGQPWRGDLAIACVSSAEKSISLFFTVAGGAIQSAYYDASISTPAQQYGQAQALMTLAQQLWNQSAYAEALSMTQAAVEVYRQLAAAHADNPDYQAKLVWSLSQLVARLRGAGRQAASAGLGDEAVGALGRLVAAGAAANPSWAAENLVNLSVDLVAGEEAVRAAQAAVEVYRQLAAAHADNPDYQAKLVWSLSQLVARLRGAGRQAASAGLGDEAVGALGRLVAAGAAANPSWAAENLVNLSVDLVAGEEAVRAAQAAVEVYRQLAAAHADNPDYQAKLVWSLSQLVARLRGAGRQAASAGLGDEAVGALGRLVAAGAAANPSWAAENLVNLSVDLVAGEEAVRAA